MVAARQTQVQSADKDMSTTQASAGEQTFGHTFDVSPRTPERMSKEADSLIGQGRNDFDMLVVALVVYYRISDVAQYGYGDPACYRNPRQLLEAICYREAIHYAAQSNIDSLMGAGWKETTDMLRRRFQRQADAYGLGVKIMFVGLESVHPPVQVAQAFEKVVSALQTRQGKVLRAQGSAAEIQARAEGEKAVRLAQADAYKFRRSAVARAVSKRFDQQIEAFKKGGYVYLWREYLSVLDDKMPNLRKYCVASDKVKNWVYEYNLEEQLQPNLLEGLDIPQGKSQEK